MIENLTVRLHVFYVLNIYVKIAFKLDVIYYWINKFIFNV